MDKKDALLKAATELFIKNGYKKTNISAITNSANMAAGTFYLYFKSKDSIFMEIFMEKNLRLKEEILKDIDMNAPPLETMFMIMGKNIKGMMEDPILNEWFNKESYHKIEKSWRAEKGIEQMDFMAELFVNLIQKWQDQDMIRNDIRPEMIVAIFGALINIDTHKEEIGEEYFPEIMNYLGEFIMKGLMG